MDIVLFNMATVQFFSSILFDVSTQIQTYILIMDNAPYTSKSSHWTHMIMFHITLFVHTLLWMYISLIRNNSEKEQPWNSQATFIGYIIDTETNYISIHPD